MQKFKSSCGGNFEILVHKKAWPYDTILGAVLNKEYPMISCH